MYKTLPDGGGHAGGGQGGGHGHGGGHGGGQQQQQQPYYIIRLWIKALYMRRDYLKMNPYLLLRLQKEMLRLGSNRCKPEGSK